MEQLESTRTNRNLRSEHVDSVWTLVINSTEFYSTLFTYLMFLIFILMLTNE